MRLSKIPLLFLFAVMLCLCGTVTSQVAVGKWRDHLSYNETFKVSDAGDRVYCSAANGLFYYDKDDHTLNRVNKTGIANDVGVSAYAYDQETKNLVVAYNNANLDIIRNDKALNIGDIKRSNIGGNKQINNIAFYNRCAYLACGFGIVVVDLARNEIKETYYIGDDGSYCNVNDIAFAGDMIVAATDDGIMYADKNSQILNIFSTWVRDTMSLLAGARVVKIEVDGDHNIMALATSGGDTSLYVAGQDLVFAPWLQGDIRNIKHTKNHTVVCYGDKLELYDQQRSLQHSLSVLDWMAVEVNDAELTDDGRLWMAHRWSALAAVWPDNPESLYIYSPGGPSDDNVFRLTSFDNDLIVAPGGHATTFTNNYIVANTYTLDQKGWHTLSDPDRLLANVYDITDVAVNPRDSKTRMAAAWGYGIVEIRNNTVTNLYDGSNTDGALTPYTNGGFSSMRTGAVAYDSEGNLWATNSLAQNALVVRYKNGNWKSFNTLSMISNGEIDHIICDSIYNIKLFWGRANKIYMHDGSGKMAYIDPNNGAKLETSMVNCVAQDHSGNLWIGTNKGVKVVYDLGKAFNNGGEGERSPVTCGNILYNENGITEYLLAYESVTSIVVDGANRKWIGTSTGGLYLISANGLEQIEHFTSNSSPLFSDKILSLSIMPWSGELFIGTDYGLQSFRATATYAFDEPMEDVHAFPNPVRPDYDGLIAIKGFSRDAIVHITDAAGHTVYSTVANGGQAIWNGRTAEGNRVASGVYYVFASSDDGSVRSATKILIIR